MVTPHDADLVREIFRRYLTFGTMAELKAWIGQRGITTKRWVTHGGKTRGGQPMDRTTVYRILNNRMYIGEAFFGDEWHSGIYPPIIDLEPWRAVQDARQIAVSVKGNPIFPSAANQISPPGCG